jgi:hypothetical protein
MEVSPLDSLLKRLEDAIVKLLESVRGDPWSLLIFQTLIWSFRRWAIHYLVSEDTSENMHDYVWDSHIDLVKNFAPEGLQELGVVWLSPANVGDRADSLEELNTYFLLIIDKMNKAIDTDNDSEQNMLSIFLDETLTDIIGEWLEGRTEYRIYPTHEESSDTFSTERIFTIMQKILEKNARPQKSTYVNAVVDVPINLERLEPANTEPAHVEPANTEPAHVEPANTEPANTEPMPIHEPQGQVPPHMQEQVPPHMQGQVPPHMQEQVPPHMQGQVPPHMQGYFPPHMQGQVPPHMQGQVPPHMQGQVPPPLPSLATGNSALPPPQSNSTNNLVKNPLSQKPVYLTISAAFDRRRTMRNRGNHSSVSTPANNKTRKRNKQPKQ